MKKINLSKKAKKTIIIVLGCVVFVGIILLSIPRTAYEKLFGFNKDLIEEPGNDNRPYQVVYVLSEKDEFVGLKVKVDEIEKDQIVQKWNLLTSKVSTYPMGYYSPIETSTVLNDYEIYQDQLTLCLSEDFLNSDGKNAIASIAWTFCCDDIEKVVIKVNDQRVNKLQDYSFVEINKNISVNYIFETSYLYESDWSTIVYNKEDYYLPVTYFYKNIDEAEFVASKLLSDEIIKNDAFTCEVKDGKFSLNLAVDTVLSTESIEEISETVKLNFNVDSLEINNNVMMIYEETFSEQTITGSAGSQNTTITN